MRYTRIVASCVVGLLATTAWAQDEAEEIDLALRALPTEYRVGASVVALGQKGWVT